MKHFLCFGAALLILFQLKAQNKDCKFVKAKTPTGQTFSMVQVPSRYGNFLIGKADGKITLVYSTKTLISVFATDNTKSQTVLKIDSAQFLFDNNSVITLKVIAAIGTVANSTNQLKPQMTSIQYSVVLVPGSKPESLFQQSKLKGFQVIAEKDGQYSDLFNDKQQDKLLQAFTCIL